MLGTLLLAGPALAQISPRYTASPAVWVEEDDPVMAAALQQLGPGWQPLPRNTACTDPREFHSYNKLCSFVAREVRVSVTLDRSQYFPLQYG